jgi:cell division protein FtsI (penicillin-binding protein 3)
MHGVLVGFVVALIGRAAFVQVVQHEYWRTEARRHQVAEVALPAPRGDIEDMTGVPVAFSRELVRISVAGTERRDIAALGKAMRTAGIPASEIRRATAPNAKFIELRGVYLPTRVAPLNKHYGVKLTRVADREYFPSPGARQVLGLVDRDGRGTAGLEAMFDSVLQGEADRSRVVKGRGGQVFESPEMLDATTRRGHTLRLTINRVLQSICDKALADAVRRLRADGGDVVVLQPHTGEVLCLSAKRPGDAYGGATAIIEPYEPGSTLKPFFAARLLQEGKAAPDDVVETFNGRWEHHGRVITDTHKEPAMSLRDVIRFSSNIGMVQFASRLDDGTVYELLRDLGFGTATGVPYPAEATGTLREPRRWTPQSRASLAMGYEISVTPLQLALAYGALANDGKLLAPALVREVRAPDGSVVWRQAPRVVRRVFAPGVAAKLLPLLESVVDSGTAVDAGLESFQLAGKSGTARRTVNGKYGSFTYTSSFVGLFPARDPQFVVLAKVDNPREESIYGGKVAAPVAKAVIQGALAARDASLDWGALVPQQQRVAVAPEVAPETVVALGQVAPDRVPEQVTPAAAPLPPVDTATTSTRFRLASPLDPPAKRRDDIVIPDVRGLPLRAAVRQLHRSGVGVRLISGAGGVTSPAAGARVAPGTVVTLARP